MGPAILFCPSSSAVHLWGQIAPIKKAGHREGSISLPHGFSRCSANADFTVVSRRRQACFFNPATSSDIYCKPYPFAWRRVSAAATGSEVSVEEAAVAASEESAEEILPSEPSSSNGEEAAVATERKTPARRMLSRSNSNANKAVVVSPEELIPGATFPGKVISIQTFGAFVDVGAFTNGLIHISRLSKSYVKKVEDVVQVGQDVKVQVLEFDSQANRISLMLVQEGQAEAPQAGEAGEKKQPQRSSQQQARSPRRDSSKRPPNSQRQAATTTMKKNEIVTGTVKNMIRSGVFLTLPDGTDGYLPAGEVIFKGPNTNMESQFQVGQELTVRVLRIDKGRVNLTMRREVNYVQLNEDLNKGVVDGATNPFEIAFRRNEMIASFLADRDKQKAQAEVNEETTESPVEEMKDVAAVVKPAVEEEEGVATSEVDAVKGEMVSSEGVNPVEELKDLKPVVEQEEDAADGVEQKAVATNEEIMQEEAVRSVEEAKDESPLAEKPTVEEANVESPVAEKPTTEEDKDVAIDVDARKDDGVSSETGNPLEVVKDIAEEEKPRAEEEKDVATGVDAREDLVKDVAEEGKLAAEEEKDVAVGVDEREDVGVSPESVSSIREVKDAMPMVKKPAVEEEKDVAEEDKPAEEEKEEEAVSGIDAMKESEKLVVEEDEVAAVRSVQ